MENKGASVVISHHIINGKESQYEEWLNEIGPLSRKAPGFIDWQIIRPIANLTFIYTIIIRFSTIENLKLWMNSQERKNLIEKANPFFRKGDNFEINSGLDFLFSPPTPTKTPPKWKQFLITWSAIYPLAVIIPLLIIPFLRAIKIPQNHYTDPIFITGIVVLLMVFIIMPNYTKLIRNWLYH